MTEASHGDDAWKEIALVSIAAQAGADIPFGTLIETIDVDLGEKQIDGVALVNGGRIDSFTPETDTVITFEAYPIYAGTDSTATSGEGFFDLLHEADTTDPLKISNSRDRTKYRIAIMFCNADSITNAATAVSTAIVAKRYVFADGYFVSVKPSFTDKILKYTVAFKLSPFDKSNKSKILFESTKSTTSLTALASYTSTVKW